MAEPEDPRLDAADDALMSGDLDEAEQAYRKILADRRPTRPPTAGLAQVGLLRRVGGVDPAAALAAAEAAPDDVDAQLLAADIEVLSGQAEQAYARLVDLVRRTAGEDRETVRQHLVSLFAIAGPDDPAVAAGPPRPARSALLLSRDPHAPHRRPRRAVEPRPASADADFGARAAPRRPARCATTACWPGSAPATPAASPRPGTTRATGGPATG